MTIQKFRGAMLLMTVATAVALIGPPRRGPNSSSRSRRLDHTIAYLDIPALV